MPTIEVNDGRLIAYEEWGDLSGRPMFQLHGTPGCRLSRHPDATLYPSLHLHVITIDRPGYGESTALPGRRVSHAAHDVAAVADEVGLDRFFVVGGSGGGPHALACAAELGDRVLGCAPVASAAPLIPAEIDGLLGINHHAHQVLADGGREGMVEFLATLREHFLADPIGTLDNQLADAPRADIEWSQREDVRTVLREGRSKLFAQALTVGSTTRCPYSATTGESTSAERDAPSASGTATTTRTVRSRRSSDSLR